MNVTASATFNGTDLGWTTEQQELQDGALLAAMLTCPCCDISLELVAEFAAFQVCADYAAGRTSLIALAA